MTITLADFELRYKNIREQHPELGKCSVKGCNNPQDITMMGEDSSCSYHRLLFDWWTGTLDYDNILYYFTNQRARRTAFTKYRNRLGVEECDKIVLMMAQDAINWEC